MGFPLSFLSPGFQVGLDAFYVDSSLLSLVSSLDRLPDLLPAARGLTTHLLRLPRMSGRGRICFQTGFAPKKKHVQLADSRLTPLEMESGRTANFFLYEGFVRYMVPTPGFQ